MCWVLEWVRECKCRIPLVIEMRQSDRFDGIQLWSMYRGAVPRHRLASMDGFPCGIYNPVPKAAECCGGQVSRVTFCVVYHSRNHRAPSIEVNFVCLFTHLIDYRSTLPRHMLFTQILLLKKSALSNGISINKYIQNQKYPMWIPYMLGLWLCYAYLKGICRVLHALVAVICHALCGWRLTHFVGYLFNHFEKRIASTLSCIVD